MKSHKKFFVILCFGVVYFFITYAPQHFHSDGKFHPDCLECKLTQSLYSMETPAILIPFVNFYEESKVPQDHFIQPLFVTNFNFFIRPPPWCSA